MWFSAATLLVGVGGLTGLYFTFRDNALIRRGIVWLLCYQAFWYLVRIVVMVRIWRQEPAIGGGQKLWLGITAPIYVLIPIMLGQGKLSAWLSDPAEASG